MKPDDKTNPLGTREATPTYQPQSVYAAAGIREEEKFHALPGDYPFRRGLYRDGYQRHSWVKKLISGYGTADETRTRQQELWESGQEGVGGTLPLHIVVDIPTANGYDSDDPIARDEVGLCGVAIDSTQDIRDLIRDFELERLNTTFILAGPAPAVLAMYIVVMEEGGVARGDLAGQVWNNPLSEYVTSMWPTLSPRGALRTMTDTMRFCANEMPRFRAVNLDGYNVREAGSTAVQEASFMIAEALELIREASAPGDVSSTSLAKTITFSWAVHSDFFEEIAKFRASRQVYAELLSEKFGIEDASALRLKAHAQTAGSTLTAQAPLNNIARVALEALAAVLGGCQSMHTSSYDEALGIPTSEAAKLALMTQHIVEKETNVNRVADPLGGSWYVEDLTNWMAASIREEVERIEGLGGFTRCVEQQTLQQEIAQSALEQQRRVGSGDLSVVGVNVLPQPVSEIQQFQLNQASQTQQIESVMSLRNHRDNESLRTALGRVESAASSDDPILPGLIEVARLGGTLGEMVQALQRAVGAYDREVVLGI